jgi:hypothetical protein
MEKNDEKNETFEQHDESDEPEPKNEYIDKLTLELFMNRNNYNKYLAKTDPKKFDSQREYKMKLKKYMVEIIDITSELIENPENTPNSEIGGIFMDYSKSIIKFLEMKELEQSNSFYNSDNGKEEETMFDPEKMDENQPKWSSHKVKKVYRNGFFF